jgi:hypothetical protein
MEPLDAELEGLVGAERQRPGMPPEAQARLWDRLGPAIVGAGGPASPPRPGDAVVPGARRLSRATLALTAGAFVAGGVVGAGLHAVLGAREQPAPRVERSAPPPARVDAAPAAELAPPPAPAPPEHPAKIERRAVAPARHGADSAGGAPERDTALAAERAVIEVARTAMARGEPELALRALDEHAARFPLGRLSEERDALAVRALAGAGRTAEARVRASEFRRHYPGSLLSPLVEEVIRSNP